MLSNITTELSTIQNGRYGEDVRSAIHDAIEKVNNTTLTDTVDNKVDKIDGKGLSTNDYTTEEKNKLAGIEAGAKVNVNADWNAVSGDAQILNKPTIPVITTDLTESGKAADAKTVGDNFNAKQDNLTFDSTPTANSTNPVTSNGIKDSLDSKVDKVSGKDLSTNDYTNADKIRVEEILLLADYITGTTQEATVANGFVEKIVHKSGNTIIRTDTFVRNGDIFTESRVLSTGEKLTIVTDLATGNATITKEVVT